MKNIDPEYFLQIKQLSTREEIYIKGGMQDKRKKKIKRKNGNLKIKVKVKLDD